jgi:hypothetical protein
MQPRMALGNRHRRTRPTARPAARQICDPRVLLHGRPDCEHMAQGRPVDAWMWGGASLEEALDLFTEACERGVIYIYIYILPYCARACCSWMSPT